MTYRRPTRSNWLSRRTGRRTVLRGGAAVTAGLAGAALIGCGAAEEAPVDAGAGTSAPGATADAGRPRPGGTAVFVHSATIPNLDLHVTISPLLSGGVGGLVLNGLMKHATSPDVAPTSWQIEGDLAEHVEQPDDRTYVFRLREEARWQDLPPYNGRPVVAEDIVRSYERQATDDPRFISAYLINWIESARAIDERTVEIVADAPNSQALHGIAVYQSPIVPMEQVDRLGSLEQAEAWVGTGPYILRDYRPGVGFTLERNPDYWEPDTAFIDRVDLRDIADPSAQLAAFLAGEVDELNGIQPEMLRSLESSRPDAVVKTWSAVGGHAYKWAVDKGPFQDLRVRQAWDLLIDRRSMVGALVGDAADFRTTFLSPGFTDFALDPAEEESRMVVDLAEARRLLEAAGYGDGFQAPLNGNNTTEQAWIEWAISRGREVGIAVAPDVTERTVYLKRQQDRDYEVGQVHSIRAYPDPNDYLQPFFHSAGSKNYSNVSEPVLDALIEEQLAELDVERRRELLQVLARRWHDDFAYDTWTYTNHTTSAVAGRLKNYTTRPNDLRQVRYAWIDEA